MHTRVIYVVKRLPGHTQVPTDLWADDWHFLPAGLQAFATLFAQTVVGHLRANGHAVEGFE